MKIFLAGLTPFLSKKFFREYILKEKIYVLESFYYINSETTKLIPSFKDFLLDSGAFTFMADIRKKGDEYEYLKKFIQYINANNIRKFFELDIDSIVGYQKVLEMRKLLEKETQRKCIPVFHKSRGLKEWEKMCEEYNYIAIGTIGEYRKYPQVLKQLLKIADSYNTKVHGLGFTQISHLKDFKFYSVDSTSWTCGNRFGYLYKFNGLTLEKINKLNNTRLKSDICINHNFVEWVKYQKYADMKF